MTVTPVGFLVISPEGGVSMLNVNSPTSAPVTDPVSSVVGLIERSPELIDKIKGALVDTALLGALFVLICDVIARSVMMPYELPIELIVGIIGSVMFIAMLIYKLNHGRKAIRFGQAKEGSCCG